ncbi:hypothetical protein D3C76_1443990 [compost metagenome]
MGDVGGMLAIAEALAQPAFQPTVMIDVELPQNILRAHRSLHGPPPQLIRIIIYASGGEYTGGGRLRQERIGRCFSLCRRSAVRRLRRRCG